MRAILIPRLAFLSIAVVAAVAACGAAPTPAPAPAPASSPAPTPTTPSEAHHHELHLPPAGPQVAVVFDGKQADATVASVPHKGQSASLSEFDLVGSDGFRPGSRPPCPRLLTGAEIAAGRIDVVSHDVSFDDALKLPRCYRVRALVRLEATR